MHGKSCLTNLIEFFEGVIKKVDEGSVADVVYKDFSKIFDKVLHGGTVSKFVDDTKIGSIMGDEEGYLEMQQDHDQLGQRADIWQMEFNL
eukprot:g43460.t1